MVLVKLVIFGICAGGSERFGASCGALFSGGGGGGFCLLKGDACACWPGGALIKNSLKKMKLLFTFAFKINVRVWFTLVSEA